MRRLGSFMHWARFSGVERIVWRAIVCAAVGKLRAARRHATQRSVARLLHISPGTAWGIFIELRGAGFLVWPAHETDRAKQVGVMLTRAGEAAAAQAALLAKNTAHPPPVEFWPLGPLK